MLAETKEIFSIVKEFCIENYIIILICTNALALLLAIISLVASRKKRRSSQSTSQDEKLVNFNIERAEVNVAQLRQGFIQKLESESTEDAASAADAADANILAEARTGQIRGEQARGEEARDGGEVMRGAGLDILKDAAFEELPPDRASGVASPVVIEKLIPLEPKRQTADGFFTSKSGRVYSEEEILSKIRD